MKIYHYDKDFYYVGESEAKIDPLESLNNKQDIFLIPALSTTIEPIFAENKITKWNGDNWVLEDLILPIEPSEQEQIAQLKLKLIADRKAYLNSTDWYVVREFDIPNSYPLFVKNKRAKARIEQDEINNVQTLEELEIYNINF